MDDEWDLILDKKCSLVLLGSVRKRGLSCRLTSATFSLSRLPASCNHSISLGITRVVIFSMVFTGGVCSFKFSCLTSSGLFLHVMLMSDKNEIVTNRYLKHFIICFCWNEPHTLVDRWLHGWTEGAISTRHQSMGWNQAIRIVTRHIWMLERTPSQDTCGLFEGHRNTYRLLMRNYEKEMNVKYA
jgi:hypothetical protein